MNARERARSDGYTLDDLRPLLIGPEQERMVTLEQKFESPEAMAESVGKILPRATIISLGHGEELSAAMQPLLVSTIHETVRKDPKSFADAIYPSIGPAIRKAAAAALQEFVDRLDNAIQRTFTIESIKWRIEAARTGRSFAEVMLLHTLVYRVEHVFLMDRESALVLAHVAAEEVEGQEPDQISAMLTAIDDFARDAFHEKEGGLSYFRVGELTGIIEQGPRAALVAIVRGVANKDLEKALAETLEHIHGKYADLLAHFRGDVAAFAPVREELLACVRQEIVQKSKHSRMLSLLAVFALALLFFVCFSLYRRQQHFNAYVEALQQEPGISIIHAGGGFVRRFFVDGLSDPLATDPSTLIAKYGLRPEKVSLRFEPIYSLDPRLTEQRVMRMLAPPPSVSLRDTNGTLMVEGIASHTWIERARIVAGMLPGVVAFDDNRLYEAEAITGAQAAAATLENMTFSFDRGSAHVENWQRGRLDAAAFVAQQLFALAPRAGFDAFIEIDGQADPGGASEYNQRLSEERAENVATELRERGVPAEKLVVHGLGQTISTARRVSFAVRLVPRT